MIAPKPSSPLPGLLLFLSATTGLVDAASVLGLGKVFTANMTGNIVFLGFAAAGTPGFAVAPFVVAIATFMLGAVCAPSERRPTARRIAPEHQAPPKLLPNRQSRAGKTT